MLAPLVLLPLAMSEAAATARLTAIRDEFASHPKAESMATLQRLVDDAARTTAAGQSLIWLGGLWRGEKDDGRAERCYRQAYGYRDGAVHVAAARGLGDLAVDGRDYRRASALYQEALAGPSGEVMRAELEGKLALSHKGWRRRLWELASWLFASAVAALLVVRARLWKRRRELHCPTELFYAVPVYALLATACAGRDARVMVALAMAGAGSLVLMGAAGVSAQVAPLSGWRSTLAGVSVTLATLAILFAASNRTDILEPLLASVAP